MNGLPSPPLPVPDSGRSFAVGARLRRADRIVPVFLPFAGCPGHCVFCAQDRQSGNPSAKDGEDIRAALKRVEPALADIRAHTPGQSLELAFYGGTFTALPPAQYGDCLDFLARRKAAGQVSHARCSTRPDALGGAKLRELARAGLDLVELGVQSFDSHALAQARRGYDRETALRGCRQVRNGGLKLGIQLLPGMPGVRPEIFLSDVKLALSLRPALLRFYPCLVPQGTALAAMWREGRYAPWSLEESVDTLGQALALAWEAEVPVVRLSVAPEPAFDRAILAGPRHPSLGSMIQAEALRRTLAKQLAEMGNEPRILQLPRSCQGFLYGQAGALRPWWKAAGLPPEKIRFTNEAKARLFGACQVVLT